jgi:hypothetical protein
LTASINDCTILCFFSNDIVCPAIIIHLPQMSSCSAGTVRRKQAAHRPHLQEPLDSRGCFRVSTRSIVSLPCCFIY